jgi:hypothetical protein
MRRPAAVLHQVSVWTRQSARSELLSGGEVLLDLVHDPFDPWLVGRSTHPSGVEDEATGLGVLHEGVVDPRAVFSAVMMIDFMLSGMTTRKIAPK